MRAWDPVSPSPVDPVPDPFAEVDPVPTPMPKDPVVPDPDTPADDPAPNPGCKSWVQGWRSGESTRLPPTNVARVRFPDPVSNVG